MRMGQQLMKAMILSLRGYINYVRFQGKAFQVFILLEDFFLTHFSVYLCLYRQKN